MPEPLREQCEPFIKKILMELEPMLDENHDGVISRDKFDLFGKYLETEYNADDKGAVNGEDQKFRIQSQRSHL